MAESETLAASAAKTVDVATTHPYTFVFMLIFMVIYGLTKLATETKVRVQVKSFLHLWAAGYLLLLGLLMALTTDIALVLLVNDRKEPRLPLITASFVPLAAAVGGVFGFELLFRKLVIGLGESRFDLDATLQGLTDQAVGATLEKEVG